MALAVAVFFSLDALTLPPAPCTGALFLLYVCSSAFVMRGQLRSSISAMVVAAGERWRSEGPRSASQFKQKSLRSSSVISRAQHSNNTITTL